jgi:hypothetical protein
VDIHGIAGFQLHAEGHFILRDAGHRLGIAERAIGLAVDLVHRVQHLAALVAADAFGIVQKQHRLAGGAAGHALIDAGQEA